MRRKGESADGAGAIDDEVESLQRTIAEMQSDARERESRTHAVLELSNTLAEAVSIEEMAVTVARAVPTITGSDCALVVLIDPLTDVARMTAVTGFTPEMTTHLMTMPLPTSSQLIDKARYKTVNDDDTHGLLRRAELAAMANTPIVVEDRIVGYIVAGAHSDPELLAPTPELAEHLRSLASQASTALRNIRLADRIRYQALHDALTGLPNRALILDHAERMLARARRHRSTSAALFIDLDGFKDVNDTLGHAAGDQLLRAVASRLSATVRESDAISRLGGDEFVVLSEGAAGDGAPERIAERILSVLREPFHLDGHREAIRLTASIGIATGNRESAGELLRDADVALYQAKAAGKNCFVIFEPEMQHAVSERIALETDLRHAIRAGQFFLMYQPIFDLRSEEITGVEALIRWRHPRRGIVQPDDFVHQLEETGLIVEVGAWVLAEACRQTAIWHTKGYNLKVSVNASAKQLDGDGLVEDVRTALEESGLAARWLIVELTESDIMRDVESSARRLRAIKDLGVRIAIDDFGTGYSSLAYLAQFPVDALKIDRSFINAVGDSAEAAALIHMVVQLGKALGLETLAEGIEDRKQFDRLQLEDCDSGQGFLFARPLSAAALEAFLAVHVPMGQLVP